MKITGLGDKRCISVRVRQRNERYTCTLNGAALWCRRSDRKAQSSLNPSPLCLLSWWFNIPCLSPQCIKPWCCHHSLKCSVAPAEVNRVKQCGCKSLCGAGKEQPAHGALGRQLLSSLVCVQSSFPK